MNPKTYQARIDSILGGLSRTDYLSRSDEFFDGIGFDPSVGIVSGAPALSARPSGAIAPLIVQNGSTTTNGAVMWIESSPKSSTRYIYDTAGSVYSLSTSLITGLKDLNDTASDEPKGATANGCAYYDNYIYFARSTTVARYGPLNGTPTFTTDYWAGTLGKTALTNTSYPTINSLNGGNISLPNHVLHRHSDGKLYIADVVDNQGTIHYIATSKTTVEGDTDNSSTYDKVNVGYGLWPTAMESYGSDLVIALYEGNATSTMKNKPAKLAFWDTTSNNVNKITWVEFPEAVISALINVNGVLYAISGTPNSEGFRVNRFVGGYSFEEVAFIPEGNLPPAGAVYSNGERLFFGSNSNTPRISVPCVYFYKLRNTALSDGIFKLPARSSSLGGSVTALGPFSTNASDGLGYYPAFARSYTDVPNYAVGYFDTGGSGSGVFCHFYSRMFIVGQPFKIKKIRIPLTEQLQAGQYSLTVKVRTDNFDSTHTILSAVSTGYDGKKVLILRPQNVSGENDFVLHIETETSYFGFAMPIIIEYETYDD